MRKEHNLEAELIARRATLNPLDCQPQQVTPWLQAPINGMSDAFPRCLSASVDCRTYVARIVFPLVPRTPGIQIAVVASKTSHKQ